MRNGVCPRCGEVCVLETNSNDIYLAKLNKKITALFYNYQCDFCYDSFTTPVLDKLNLSRIKSAMRPVNRKSKIMLLFKIKKP